MKKAFEDAIAKCMLFENMTKEEFKALLDCLKFSIREYPKNSVVSVAGDILEGVGVVLSGQITVVKESADGNRTILSILNAGELFGEMAVFSGKGRWPATVVAQTNCSIMYIPAEKLVGQCAVACSGHRKLIMNMLHILSNKALSLNRKLEFLSIKGLRGRIAAFLLEFYRESGRITFLLPMKRNEMADFLNVSRPSLSRELCRMRDEGILDFHRSSICIKNVAALKAEIY